MLAVVQYTTNYSACTVSLHGMQYDSTVPGQGQLLPASLPSNGVVSAVGIICIVMHTMKSSPQAV